MKNSIASLLFFITIFTFSQNVENNYVDINGDSIVYNKNTNILQEREFSSNLQDKYSGKDFQYKEEKEVVKEDKQDGLDAGFVNFIIFFMSKIFPFLLGIIIILIILKAFLGFDPRFWKSTNSNLKSAKKLVYEDEDIHDVDLDALLKQAIEAKNFRLAIRYYYLASLKKLSTDKLIDYHKDKTNSEYLFEIENADIRNQFSYLSYVYSYVWYGEFPVNENSFALAQNKYQSFLKNIL